MTRKLSSYTKFCGLGVAYQYDTPYGGQITLLPAEIETPAMRLGLRDGDIIRSVKAGDLWYPIDSFQDFNSLIPGIEGSPLTMRIVRGVPLPPPDEGYRHTRSEEERKPHWDGVPTTEFEVSIRRERVYPGLPASTSQEQRDAVRFRSPVDAQICEPLIALQMEDASEKKLANLSPDATGKLAGILHQL